jgi:hypothetical protein
MLPLQIEFSSSSNNNSTVGSSHQRCTAKSPMQLANKPECHGAVCNAGLAREAAPVMTVSER